MHALLRRTASRLVHFRYLDVQREKLSLRTLPTIPCPTAALSSGWDEARLRSLLSSPTLDGEWTKISAEIARLGITEKAGGVNQGDRRALYYLARSLAHASVLEVGTHIGASTVHLAAALRENARDAPTPVHMTTVDVADVNDATTQPWLAFGAARAPKELIDSIGAAPYVRFVTARSLDYLATCRDRYDFIFLDGDHAARTVYQEVPLALKALNQGGVIILHDYFPHLQPLWRETNAIPGPWLAVERLRAEGARVKVLPLGELPWQTKLNSNVTSLALLVAG